MEDPKAIAIIDMKQKEIAKAMNFMTLYQDVANQMMPREDQITSKRTGGEDKSVYLYDPTAMLDLGDMVSGLAATFFPTGQQAFGITLKVRALSNLDHVRRWLALASQIAYTEMMASNFMLQLTEILGSLVGFGTGNIFTDFVIQTGRALELNYKAWDVSHYVFKQNAKGIVDTMILFHPLTARQAVEEFGQEAGPEAVKHAGSAKDESKLTKFIHLVRPRLAGTHQFMTSNRMPFESIWVNESEKLVVNESGYRQFPYCVPRWEKSPSEKWGRGQGTKVLATSKMLQQMDVDMIDYCNKFVNPPREVVYGFEGDYDVRPNGINIVQEIPASRVSEFGGQGGYPILDNFIKAKQEIIHRAFFTDVFAPLSNLAGDRRTTTEIIQRVKQAAKKLAGPVYRLQTELFRPLITRTVLLLIENGRIPQPPRELQGQAFDIEFVGELALAMQDQQARAFQQFAGLVGELLPVFPDAGDYISIARALPDIAFTYGMKAEHLATPDEITAKQQKRAQDVQQQKAMMAAQVSSDAYGKTTQKPEEGSPAESVMAGMGG
jgi:hypothetical protein